jgi:hypothetical protein
MPITRCRLVPNDVPQLLREERILLDQIEPGFAADNDATGRALGDATASTPWPVFYNVPHRAVREFVGRKACRSEEQGNTSPSIPALHQGHR